jgi:Uma2 family endonuclease
MAVLTRTYTEELTGKSRISYEEFLALPAEIEAEWVDGEVLLMPSVGVEHARIVIWLHAFFSLFMKRTGAGDIFGEPFQMKNRSGRSPDAFVLLSKNAGRLRNLFVDGPADLAIEVVSPSGARRDYVEKLREYEEAGVPEYWIIDPERREVTFFVARDGRFYGKDPVDGVFVSEAIPDLWVRESWIWEQPDASEAANEVLAARP